MLWHLRDPVEKGLEKERGGEVLDEQVRWRLWAVPRVRNAAMLGRGKTNEGKGGASFRK